jgi:hypothetical protein
MFEGVVAEFFVTPTDPGFCRNLKLEIITDLVNQDNINKILKEFKVQTLSNSINEDRIMYKWTTSNLLPPLFKRLVAVLHHYPK